MKRGFFFILLIAVSAVANAENWVLLTPLHDKSVTMGRLEVDVDSIQGAPPLVTALIRIVFNSPQAQPPAWPGKPYQTEATLMEFDCAARRHRTLQLTYFDQAGDQMIKVDRRDQARWLEVRDDRLSGLEYKSVCGRALAKQNEEAKLKFGKSSVVVEKMAKANGCQGSHGAYLAGEPGPIETYRMRCDGGSVFSALCEYGSCNQQK